MVGSATFMACIQQRSCWSRVTLRSFHPSCFNSFSAAPSDCIISLSWIFRTVLMVCVYITVFELSLVSLLPRVLELFEQTVVTGQVIGSFSYYRAASLAGGAETNFNRETAFKCSPRTNSKFLWHIFPDDAHCKIVLVDPVIQHLLLWLRHIFTYVPHSQISQMEIVGSSRWKEKYDI